MKRNCELFSIFVNKYIVYSIINVIKAFEINLDESATAVGSGSYTLSAAVVRVSLGVYVVENVSYLPIPII